ncbi:MAG TPA: enoyl-CoA hydratase-related protein [Acidimicrobiia bacterium]|nr:enoyl-CoA hydratase-related protein [Acidimicrobiia bacterium]
MRAEEFGFKSIRIERADQVLVATIDRPDNQLNAVDDRLHRELTNLFHLLRREREARAVLLTGQGKAFCAGGDFSWFPTLQSPERLAELRRDAKQMIWDLVDLELPLVVAINGPAVGLGATIALLGDVIFIAEGAHVADPHVRVGIVAGDGGTAIWPLLVGPARAKQYLLTGDPVSAHEAERIGLVNRVVPASELMTEAMAMASRLAAGAPLAIQYTKVAVNQLVKQALQTAFDYATGHELVTFMTKDHQEALAAIAEKRQPRFFGH